MDACLEASVWPTCATPLLSGPGNTPCWGCRCRGPPIGAPTHPQIRKYPRVWTYLPKLRRRMRCIRSCARNRICGQRPRPEIGPTPAVRDRTPKIAPHKRPGKCGTFSQSLRGRQIGGLRGGPGRTRTLNQTVMSRAPTVYGRQPQRSSRSQCPWPCRCHADCFVLHGTIFGDQIVPIFIELLARRGRSRWAILVRRTPMMPQPATRSNRQICDGLRFRATPRRRLSSRFCSLVRLPPDRSSRLIGGST